MGPVRRRVVPALALGPSLWNKIQYLDAHVEFTPSRDAVPHLAEYNRLLKNHLNHGPARDKLRRAYSQAIPRDIHHLNLKLYSRKRAEGLHLPGTVEGKAMLAPFFHTFVIFQVPILQLE